MHWNKQIFNVFKKAVSPLKQEEKSCSEAYTLWSSFYDHQKDNLLVDIDEVLFAKMLTSLDLKNKLIVDFGCGTGRHWEKLFLQSPSQLIGLDHSPGMLNILKSKFPKAEAYLGNDDDFPISILGRGDVLVSALTLAHCENLDRIINAWQTILKTRAEILITDYHPLFLSSGAKTTFAIDGNTISIKNYIHPLSELIGRFLEKGFRVEQFEEIEIDETMRDYYSRQNSLSLFEKVNGEKLIYGIHFIRD